MERYSLTPYQSVYKDRNSVKINELLRQRFASNFQADDAIAGAVDQMNAADFEGDMALKQELEDDTRGVLEERATRGDYETMGMDVARSARDFTQRYQPIEENYKKYQDYKQLIQDKLDKKIGEGGITEQTAQLALARSRHDYQGLQMNEDGTIDEGSFFGGYNMVGDVDISAEFDKRMEGYKMHKGAEDVQYVNQPQVDAQGRIIPGSVKLKVRKAGKWEAVPQTDVDELFYDMMADPNIQAAMNQKAHLTTFAMTDEDIQQHLLTSLDGDVNDPESGGLRAAMQKAIAEGKDEEAAGYEALIKRNEELLEGTGVETPEEMVDLRRKFLEQYAKEQEVSRELGAARSKYVRMNILENIYHQDYDAVALANYNRRADNHVADFGVPLHSVQVDNPGGNTVESIDAWIVGIDAGVSESVADLNASEAVQNLINSGEMGDEWAGFTEEDILNDNIPDNLKAIAAPHKQMIQSLRLEKQLQEKLLADARENTDWEHSTATIDYSGGGKSMSGGRILELAQEVLGNPDLNEEELRAIMDKGYYAATMGNPQFTNESGIRTLVERINQELGLGPNEASSIQGAGHEIMLDMKHSKSVQKVRTDAADDWLEENAKRQISGFGSTVAPGINDQISQDTTQAFNAFFVGNSVDASFNIGFGGREHRGTGTIAEFRESASSRRGAVGSKWSKESRNSWATGEIKVQQVLFNESPGPSGGGITLVVVNEMGDTEQLSIDKSQLRNSALATHFNSPLWRAGEAKNRAKNKGLDDFTFTLGNGIQLMFDFTETGGDRATFLIPETNSAGETVMVEKSMMTNSQEFAIEIEHLDQQKLLPF